MLYCVRCCILMEQKESPERTFYDLTRQKRTESNRGVLQQNNGTTLTTTTTVRPLLSILLVSDQAKILRKVKNGSEVI